MSKTDILKNRRTVRKFSMEPIPKPILLDIVDTARLAPYPANIQPIKYKIITENLDPVFECTKWAGYLKDGTPHDDERPVAYIMILGDKSIKASGNFETDASIAGSAIVYAAELLNIGACWLGAINRDRLRSIFSIDERYEISYLIALGYSNQKSRAVPLKDTFKYYLDDSNILNVPKRTMDDVLI